MKPGTPKKSPVTAPRTASVWRTRVPLLVLGGGLLAGALLLQFGTAQQAPAQRNADKDDPGLDAPHTAGEERAHSPTEARAPGQVTSADSPEVPPGQVPPSIVQPPKPNPLTQTPPAPVPPPDPQTSTPPMQNPGGVNGSRPPRGTR